MDSEEDAYYTSGYDMSEGEYSGGGYEDDDEAAEEPYTITKKRYTIHKEETMKQLQQNDISEVSNLLTVTRGIACTLLLRHKWSVNSVFEEWFADEDKVRASVGIISTSEKGRKLGNNHYCKICMETVECSHTLSATCGHSFCSDCWAGYVAVAISDGVGCLTLSCPEPNCAAVAGLDVVEAISAPGDQRRFHQYLFRSYVELSRTRKWCPGPGCEFAVEYGGGGEGTYDVTCDCGFKFCWLCAEEQHRPVGCETVAKWAEKNSWPLAYTKSCPQCNTKIEKNQGCSHMTCTCRHEFCWHCMQNWNGFDHVCNKYDPGSLIDATEELLRYAFYFERWASNHKSREIARADVARARDKLLPELSRAQEVPETELQFVVEAWDQIVECRRVLKWSYAYGYYVRAEERKKKEIFEFLQGEAERSLERLHHCTEKEVAAFVGRNARPCEEFGDFRVKLTNLTGVTKMFFENLVRALENDLSEVKGA